MSEPLPGISCICLTYARPHVLEEAIHSFLIQDYPGPKELIVLNDYTPQTLLFDHPEVAVINIPYRFRTVGEKMSAAVSLSRYDLICVWDDDDIYLPHRLSLSAARVTNQFFKPDQAWFLNGGQLSGPLHNFFHVGSCYHRTLFNLADGYPALGNGYDQLFEQRLRKQAAPLMEIASIPPEELYYIYRWTGTQSFHMSASGGWGGGQTEAEEWVQKQREKGNIPSGTILLHPHWNQDYTRLVLDQIDSLRQQSEAAEPLIPSYRGQEMDLSPRLEEADRKQLKLAQQKMTRMLAEIDRICRKHQIPYFLASGTLLGAVLYGGWIPWDGDIDIEVADEDYPRLRAALAEELPPGMWLQDRESDPLYNGTVPGKVRDLHSCYIDWIGYTPWHNGLQIDISGYSIEGEKVYTPDITQMGDLVTDDIFPLREVFFDGIAVFVPNRYERFLDKQYGPLGLNWHQPPPVDDRYPGEGRVDSERASESDVQTYPHLYEYNPAQVQPSNGRAGATNCAYRP